MGQAVEPSESGVQAGAPRATPRERLALARARLAAAGWLWSPLAAFVISRLAIVLVAYLSGPLLVESPNITPYHIRPDNLILDTFGSRWDTGFYLSIATEGYRYQGVPLPSVAFFPLFPLLIWALTPLTGDPLIAGLLIANAALLGAAILLHRLTADEFGPDVAARATWYLLIFPSALFGSAIYSESLFLLLAIGALWLARREHWAAAGVLGAAAALTRLVGVLVAVLLLVEWWQQRRARTAARAAPEARPAARPGFAALLAPAAVPLGTAAYMAYLQLTFGDPLAFAHAAAVWEREPESPLTMLAHLLRAPDEGWGAALAAGRLPLDDWLDVLMVLAVLVLGFALLARRRWSEGLFVVLGALLPLSSGLLMSQRRYVWVLFPIYILLARWGARPWVDRAITALFLSALALFTALFANWYWVA